jgi:hypothetical protein
MYSIMIKGIVLVVIRETWSRTKHVKFRSRVDDNRVRYLPPYPIRGSGPAEGHAEGFRSVENDPSRMEQEQWAVE